jgi:hypothetical protein
VPPEDGSLPEFEEIGHSGGKVTFHLTTDESGHRSYQSEFVHCRPARVVLIGVYALAQGVPVAEIQLGGIGQAWNPPPIRGCLAVFVASDSQGQFGHNCPRCRGYWRSGPWPNVCPYCAERAPGHQFLSDAQRRYVAEYCERLVSALEREENGDVVIDMDAVAAAVGSTGEKPPFYVSETSQQHKFTCAACREFNDILGRFGYCSSCGTRNDLALFRDVTVREVRERINAGHPPEDCARDAVARFDSYLAQYGRELAANVPLTEGRKRRLLKQPYHNGTEISETFSKYFDIDVRSGISDDEWDFAKRMLLRRHVYEHNGGEVDQEYLAASGDTSVSLKQHIHETKEGAHRLLNTLVKMAQNVHDGFHELLPPIPEPIRAFEAEKDRLARLRSEKRS